MPTITEHLEDHGRRRLAVAVVCSLAIHAGGFALLLVGSGGLGGVAPLPVVLPPAEDEADQIHPGIEQSRQVTINWLGFDDPTPHSAALAETEQAALSPTAAGDPAALQPQAEVSEVARPVENPAEVAEIIPAETLAADPRQPETDPDRVPEAYPATPIEDATGVVEGAETAVSGVEENTPAAAVLAVEREVPDATSRLFRRLSRAAAQAREVFARARAAEAMRESKQAADPPKAAAPSPIPGESRDAIASERESDATSRARVVEWEPGKPAAAEGLDITTVRPRWTVTTKITAVPRNPVVRIEFRKNGTVARAAYLEGQGSGYPNVDGPLLDAIYAWTARGRALDELPTGDPDAVTVVTMRIILIPGSGTMRRNRSDR